MSFTVPTQADTFKVLVVGAFGIGKTTLIQQISQVPVIGTEVRTSGSEAEVKPTTTVGMEYGVFSVGDDEATVTLLLFGTPGQDRFEAMREVAASGLDGLIVIVDGDKPPTWEVGHKLLGDHNPTGDLPTLVVVNRWGAGMAQPPELAESLAVDPRCSSIVHGDVVDRDDAHRFVIELLTLILSMETHSEEDGTT